MLIDKFDILQGTPKVNSSHPVAFYPELSDDRLRIIAVDLLDIRYSTFREMNSPFDDNYTRETAVFGRSRNMLIDMALNGQHDWMSLKHAAMDVTFNIGQVPCRFFRDDPNSPEKSGFFKRNAVDDLFAMDEQHPVMWRFVVDKALTEDDEDRVFFVGYNVYQEKVSEWMYRASAPTLHAVDKDVPAAAEIPPAFVDVREDDSASQGSDRKTGSDE
jgi:hypothetical protein